MSHSALRRPSSVQELDERYSVLDADRSVLMETRHGPQRLGMTIVLLSHRQLGFVPIRSSIPAWLIAWAAGLVGVSEAEWRDYHWKGRNHHRNVAAVRRHHGTRRTTAADRRELQVWLQECAWQCHRQSDLIDEAVQWMRAHSLEVSSSRMLKEWAQSARCAFEAEFDARIVGQLSAESRTGIEALLKRSGGQRCALDVLRGAIGTATQSTLKPLTARLQIVQQLGLSVGLFDGVAPRVLQAFVERAQGDDPWLLRRYSSNRRLARAAVALHALQHRLIDDVVTVFLGVVHRNRKQAVKTSDQQAQESSVPAKSRDEMLLVLLEELLGQGEDGSCGPIFERLGRESLELVHESMTAHVLAKPERRTLAICDRYRRTARSHLRRALEVLEFEARSVADLALLQGLELVLQFKNARGEHFPMGTDLPMQFVSKSWENHMTEATKDGPRVVRYRYEACVVHKLDAAIRGKRVWVKGAYKYRDPEQDLPQDWAATRDSHYADFQQPTDPLEFVRGLRANMESALHALEARQQSRHSDVQILERAKGSFWKVPPIKARPVRPILALIKHHVEQKVGTLHLSDALLEVHRQLELDQFFETSGQRQVLTRDQTAERLLLTVFGLGTNLGLKRIHTASRPSCDYRDLRYFERRYVSVASLEEANIALTNRILQVREAEIWPDGMKLASDGKHMPAWSNNAMNEFNPHYGKYGVMAYWHVERNALCVHVDVATVGHSQVTAMLQGIARHETAMQIASNAVDSNGQSELGFAITHMLGVDLRPRLRRIKDEKLCLPDPSFLTEVPALEAMMSSHRIKWHLIEQQYDEMTRVVAAVARGTAPVDSILRRYNRYSATHPTYNAFLELGKVLKTTFLCRYLGDLELRTDIHDALNVVENWNSCLDFIFYGRRATLSTNDPERMRKSVACLRLLQNSLVFVNTMLVQEVVREHGLLEQLTAEDLRALTPLFTSHVNACGDFDLSTARPSVLRAA